ncbi:MAG TPA: hypothetical protein VIZ58_06280, partial [Thermoanaerobaculia bacterium]
MPLPGFDGARAVPPPPPADDPFAAIDDERPASAGAPPPPPSQSQGENDPFAADLPEMPAPPPPSSAAKQEEAMNFDFVDSKPKSPSAADMLDFVDDASNDADKKKRPPPPVVGKPGGAGSEETLDFSDDPAPGPADGARSKKADKEQKKREREERAAREREERARRKEARSSGTGETGLRSVMRPGRLIALAVLLGIGAVGALGYRARRTPAGLFWMNLYLPAKK